MSFKPFPSAVILAGAFGVGALAGWLRQPRADTLVGLVLSEVAAPAGAERGAVTPSLGSESKVESEPTQPLANQSEKESFGEFELAKQADVLRRLSVKGGNGLPPSSLVLLAKIVPQLSADQTAALLQDLPSGKLENEEVRRFLVERLAELDPQRAMELGKTLGDSKMMAQVVSVRGEEDAAAALRLLKDLPADRAKEALAQVFEKQHEGGAPMQGAVSDVVAVLKELPAAKELLENKNDWRPRIGMAQMLAGLVAKDADKDPAAVLASVNTISSEIAAFKNGGKENSEAQAELSMQILNGVLGALRAQNPQAASVFFDAIPAGSKTAWMFGEEAHSRLQNKGVDAAIALAEKQSNEEFAKRAASGTWWGLAQQDRQTALTWIESLPEGAFRTGVLNAVMFDAWMQSMSWGSDRAAIEAGAKLLSKASQMDYFASLMSDRRFSGRGSSPSEMIAQLPLSDGDKAELYRRVAPLRTK
jgi:hypothetical protein